MKTFVLVGIVGVILGVYYYNPQLVTNEVNNETILASSLETIGKRYDTHSNTP
jgi:uncharacterized membrane protein YpjA